MAAIRLAGAAGRMLFERYNRDEADSLIETAPRLTAPNSFPREHLRIVQLGRAFTGIHFADARWVWEAAKRLDEFVGRWKAGGHKSPLTRIPSDIAIETGWKHADYKVFAALCALNAAIGSKPYAVVTRNRIRAEILALLKTRFLSIAHDPHAAAHALHFCECSNPATHKSGPDWICDRCRALET